eukprot:1701561-Prymnesium_polylepis.1
MSLLQNPENAPGETNPPTPENAPTPENMHKAALIQLKEDAARAPTPLTSSRSAHRRSRRWTPCAS